MSLVMIFLDEEDGSNGTEGSADERTADGGGGTGESSWACRLGESTAIR